MDRRKFLVGLGGVSISGSALVGTGAFSRVESQRAVTVQVAEDPYAFLGLAKCGYPDDVEDYPNSSYAHLDEKGHLAILMNEENPDHQDGLLGAGVNSNSRTWFDNVFQICNQGKETICVYIDDDEDWPYFDEDERRVEFYPEDDRDGSLIGEENEVELELGECLCVGIRTRTHSLSDGDELLAAIGDALGSPGSMEAVIETTVVFSGTFEGQSVSHVEQLDLAVDPAGNRYDVEDPGVVTEQFTTTETEVVEQEPDLLGMIGGPMLLLIGLVSAGSLAFVRQKRLLALTPHERAYLRYLDDRAEFEDWINRITLPDATLDRPVAEADRLRDLVDFALDNDTGVIEDTQTGEYHVLTSDVRYTFVPPEPEPTPSLTLPDFEDESTDPGDEEA